MQKLDSNAKRTYIHELGHFIADTINDEKYGLPKVERFYLEYNKDRDDYTGGIKLESGIEPKDLPIEKLSHKLTAIMYGCFFQTYLNRSDFAYFEDGCLNKEHGRFDADVYRKYAQQHLLLPEIYKLRELQKKHLQNVVDNRYLDELMHLDTDKYITQTESGYEIDVNELRKGLNDLIEKYEPIYSTFVKEQQELIYKIIKERQERE